MMPQSNLFVAAPLKQQREADLRSLLASMNVRPGVVDPGNKLVPFGQFDRIHFARFVILEDQTLNDIHTVYGLPAYHDPVMLAFIADFDGGADELRTELAQKAGSGLQQIFSCCEGFTAGGDIAAWMKDHEQPPAAVYGNWVGRTVRQIHEEESLRRALEDYVRSNSSLSASGGARQIHEKLNRFVESEATAGRIVLSKEPPTPLGWRIRKFIHLIGVPLILLILSPFLLLYSPFFLYQLRKREKSDGVLAPRPDSAHEARLSEIEDHDVTNQFSAMGSIKPGLFRRWTLAFLLSLIHYAARHIYVRGHLARVPTIHFARWVFLNEKRRVLFASNYDGSLDSYMDDFINKVGWGLNLAFTNGIGYPTTRWLVLDGSKDEQKFKYFLRRHELPTEVWYNAHPGLTAFDLKRNTLIREGLERSDMNESELRDWVALL